jgi:hypothetical protein
MADLKTQIGCLASRIEVNQEKMDAWLEEMKAWLKRRLPAKKRRRTV